jgi:hypothetical protein
VDLGGKVLHPADHQGQAAFGLSRLGQRLSLLLHPGEPLLQAGDARLELVAVDDPFGIAVDQPADPPVQALDRAVEGCGLVPVARALLQLVETTLVFSSKAGRILQESTDLGPDRQLEAVAAYRAIGTRRHAAEAMPVSSEAAVVAILGLLAAADLATGHLAVEGVAAAAADHQALEQPTGTPTPFPPVSPVLVQLGLCCREQRRLDQGGHRDLDPLLSSYRDAGVGLPRWPRAAPDRAQADPRWHET